MIGKFCLDQLADFFCYRIWYKTGGGRDRHVFIWWLAVVTIIIPLPACGRALFHQNACLAAQFAIEKLHPQLLAPLCPAGKGIDRAVKTVIFQDFHWKISLFAPLGDILQDPIFRWVGDKDFIQLVAVQSAFCLAGKAVGVILVGQFYIIDLPAFCAQGFGKMAHG